MKITMATPPQNQIIAIPMKKIIVTNFFLDKKTTTGNIQL